MPKPFLVLVYFGIYIYIYIYKFERKPQKLGALGYVLQFSIVIPPLA